MFVLRFYFSRRFLMQSWRIHWYGLVKYGMSVSVDNANFSLAGKIDAN